MTPTPPSSAPTFKCSARSSAYIGGFIENSERQREEADRWHTGRVETAGANGPNRIKSSESSQPHHMRTEGEPCRRGQVTGLTRPAGDHSRSLGSRGGFQRYFLVRCAGGRPLLLSFRTNAEDGEKHLQRLPLSFDGGRILLRSRKG